MSGNRSRGKGRRGQATFANMLSDRDWIVHELNAGKSAEDFIATDPDGKTWSIEVKCTDNIMKAHVWQAQNQGKRSRKPWLLASKLFGTRCWLIRRQGMDPVVWRDKE